MLPNPWIIVGFLGALIAASVGGFFYGDHVRGVQADRDIAQLHAYAEKAVIDHNAKVAQIDNDNIVNTLTMQAQYEAKLQAAENDNTGYAKRFADLLRKRPASCGGQLSAETTSTERAQNSPTGGDGDYQKELERILSDLAGPATN